MRSRSSRATKGPKPPIAKLIGFDLVNVELGEASFKMDAGPQHANPMGTTHGGIFCDVGDAAMGFAMATTLEDDESFTTLDLNAKYFKPIWTAKLRATARVTKRTKSLGLIECEITDENGDARREGVQHVHGAARRRRERAVTARKLGGDV